MATTCRYRRLGQGYVARSADTSGQMQARTGMSGRLPVPPLHDSKLIGVASVNEACSYFQGEPYYPGGDPLMKSESHRNFFLHLTAALNFCKKIQSKKQYIRRSTSDIRCQ